MSPNGEYNATFTIDATMFSSSVYVLYQLISKCHILIN